MSARLPTVQIHGIQTARKAGEDIIIPVLCASGDLVGLQASPRVWALIEQAVAVGKTMELRKPYVRHVPVTKPSGKIL